MFLSMGRVWRGQRKNCRLSVIEGIEGASRNAEKGNAFLPDNLLSA